MVDRSRTVAVLAALALVGAAACDRRADPRPAPPPASLAPATGWQRLADAPSQRTEVAAAVLGSRIYVVGGFRADGATVPTVEIFDTVTGRWAPGPDLPEAVNHAMATTLADTVYVFGGYRSDGTAGTGAFRLDGAGWRAVAPLPEARAAGTAVTVAGNGYVAGGIGPGTGLAGRMLVYDPTADRWSTADGPPTPREHLGGAATGGLLYTVGGRTAAAGNLAAFEAYDPATRRWTRLPDLPTARGGLAATATAAGHVVAVGGEARTTFREAEVYTVAAGSWRGLPALPTPRHGLGVVVVGTVLYALAGGPEPGLHVAATTEAIDLASLPDR